MTQPIEGTGDDDVLNGTANDDVIDGLAGDDMLSGGDGNDTLNGGADNDSLTGGNGVDMLNGGAGDDLLNGGGGTTVHLTTQNPSDVINGGGGNDTLYMDYRGFFMNGNPADPASMKVDISTGSGGVTVKAFLGEAFSSIEKLYFQGPDGNDIVTGGALNDTIGGFGGDDVLRGGLGDDAISDTWGRIDASGGAGNDSFSLNRGDIGHQDTADDVIDGNAGTLTVGGAAMGTFRSFESLTATGGFGNDTILGVTHGENVLGGGGGNDTLTGGKLTDGLAGDDGNDTINGGGGDDFIDGGAGTNTLNGGGGNDDITVSGTDTVTGGVGDDTIRVGSTTALSSNNIDGGGDSDTLVLNLGSTATLSFAGFGVRNIETLHGGSFQSGTNYTLNMTTSQFAQFSKIDFGTFGEHVTIAFTNSANVALPASISLTAIQLANSGQRIDLSTATALDNVGILGGNGNDTVIGGANSNGTISLGNGADHFAGGTAGQTVNGDDGNDVLIGGTGSLNTLDGGNGNDTITGGNAGNFVSGDDGNDKLIGGHGTNVLNGGIGNDTLTGNVASDTLFGGAGKDTMTSGGGTDRILYGSDVPESNAANFDVVKGYDAATSKFDFTFTVTGVDAMIRQGDASRASLDADLANIIDATKLGASHAVLFIADAGDLSGATFLIVDANGMAGYQQGADFVIQLAGGLHLAHLSTTDFM